jgi:hypothetical protein
MVVPVGYTDWAMASVEANITAPHAGARIDRVTFVSFRIELQTANSTDPGGNLTRLIRAAPTHAAVNGSRDA